MYKSLRLMKSLNLMDIYSEKLDWYWEKTINKAFMIVILVITRCTRNVENVPDYTVLNNTENHWRRNLHFIFQ